MLRGHHCPRAALLMSTTAPGRHCSPLHTSPPTPKHQHTQRHAHSSPPDSTRRAASWGLMVCSRFCFSSVHISGQRGMSRLGGAAAAARLQAHAHTRMHACSAVRACVLTCVAHMHGCVAMQSPCMHAWRRGRCRHRVSPPALSCGGGPNAACCATPGALQALLLEARPAFTGWKPPLRSLLWPHLVRGPQAPGSGAGREQRGGIEAAGGSEQTWPC